MSEQGKKTRLEYVFGIYENDYKRAVAKKVYTKKVSNLNQSENPDNRHYYFYDNNFVKFYEENCEQQGLYIEGDTPMVKMFNFYIECDPTQNKEYVSWFINLHRHIIKRIIKGNEASINEEDASLSLEHSIFFEDLQSKVKEGLEVFSFLKKTNVLSVETRDINNFKKIADFIDFIKPYMTTDMGDDSVHTLDHKELKCIQNFVQNNKTPGQAELVFENDEWVIVITHDKDANKEFGKYTSWCTAGTRYGNMFDSYHSRGELFVLIKKGFGSKKAIDKQPEVRLQFHFEDDMFMNALDRGVNINEFLFEHKDIKKYFKEYIIKRVLPYRQKKNHKQSEDIKYLLKLGFGDEIVKILKESKPKLVDFSGHKIEDEYLIGLGEITTIEKLDLSDCGINELPKSIRNLTKLKHLKFRNNKNITKIPDWVGELSSLEYLDCAGCNIDQVSDIVSCTKLTELVLDYNPTLRSLPKNIGALSKLVRLTASSCNLIEINDDILNCHDLFLLDVHSNPNLERIPVGLSKLPNIVAICIDDTKVSQQTKKLMESDSNGSVCIIKYG
jgi:Leucine-rich repeat (LRR) protein